MVSHIDIANLALIKLGFPIISSFEEDNYEAKLIGQIYYLTLDSELSLHNWYFATKFSALNNIEDSGEYNLPKDLLQVVNIYANNIIIYDYIIYQDKLTTENHNNLTIKYIAKIRDPNLLHANFIELLATKLALQLSDNLTKSDTKRLSLNIEYKNLLKTAKFLSANFNKYSLINNSNWLDIREST